MCSVLDISLGIQQSHKCSQEKRLISYKPPADRPGVFQKKNGGRSGRDEEGSPSEDFQEEVAYLPNFQWRVQRDSQQGSMEGLQIFLTTKL